MQKISLIGIFVYLLPLITLLVIPGCIYNQVVAMSPNWEEYTSCAVHILLGAELAEMEAPSVPAIIYGTTLSQGFYSIVEGTSTNLCNEYFPCHRPYFPCYAYFFLSFRIPLYNYICAQTGEWYTIHASGDIYFVILGLAYEVTNRKVQLPFNLLCNFNIHLTLHGITLANISLNPNESSIMTYRLLNSTQIFFVGLECHGAGN